MSIYLKMIQVVVWNNEKEELHDFAIF